MNLRNRLEQQHLFFRLMGPYVLFIMFALALGWIIYNQTYKIVEDEVTNNNLQLLNQVKGTLDSRFSEIGRMAFQQLGDPRVQNFQRISDPFNAAQTYKVIETQKSLYNYSVSNNFVLDYYLVFKNSDLVLSYNSTYELPMFYRYVLSYPGTDYEEWKADLLGSYRNGEVMASGPTNYQEKPSDILTYVHSLGYPNYVQGALLVLVANENIQALLKPINVADGGWAAVFDKKGKVIAALPQDATASSLLAGSRPEDKEGIIEPSKDTGGMVITYATSGYNGWRYVVAQPPSVVLSRLNSIRQITVDVFIIFFTFGLAMAYLFARDNGRPLKSLVSTLEGARGSREFQRPRDIYAFLQNSLSHLVSNYGELQDEMNRQAPLLWDSFFSRLIKGDVATSGEINSLLEHQNVKISGSGYLIAILHFHASGNGMDTEMLQALDVERVLVKDTLRRVLEDERFMHDIAQDKVAILFVDHGGDGKRFSLEVEEELSNIHEELKKRLRGDIRFAMGDPRSSLIEIAGSFEEARQALSAIDYDDEQERIIRFSGLERKKNAFYFPSEAENRLTNYVKAGETGELEKMLQALYRENYQERRLPLAMQQLFLAEIVGCLVKVEEQAASHGKVDMKQLLQFLGAGSDPKRAYDEASSLFLEISREIDRRKKSRNVRLFDEIVAYVQDNYGDSNLCLDSVADRFHISKGYMSQFFKEQAGENFSDYVEMLRLKIARELLAGTSKTIAEIAESTGYNSSNTFCRAFKRSGGVSATSFRENASRPRSGTPNPTDP